MYPVAAAGQKHGEELLLAVHGVERLPRFLARQHPGDRHEPSLHAIPERLVDNPEARGRCHDRLAGRPRRALAVTRPPAEIECNSTCRKRIEEIFGWIKKPGGLAKARVRGRPKVEAAFAFAVVAYNLGRIPKLVAAHA